MFTLKIIDHRSAETIVFAKKVWTVTTPPRRIGAPSTLAKVQYEPEAGGHESIGHGIVYVMNPQGATVAKYEFDPTEASTEEDAVAA